MYDTRVEVIPCANALPFRSILNHGTYYIHAYTSKSILIALYLVEAMCMCDCTHSRAVCAHVHQRPFRVPLTNIKIPVQ